MSDLWILIMVLVFYVIPFLFNVALFIAGVLFFRAVLRSALR
jgi:hypothetical protein